MIEHESQAAHEGILGVEEQSQKRRYRLHQEASQEAGLMCRPGSFLMAATLWVHGHDRIRLNGPKQIVVGK